MPPPGKTAHTVCRPSMDVPGHIPSRSTPLLKPSHSPSDCPGLGHTAHATWYFPQTPIAVSGGKGPDFTLASLCPRKRGLITCLDSGVPRERTEASGVERVGNWGLGKNGRKPQDILQSFSSNLEAGHEIIQRSGLGLPPL